MRRILPLAILPLLAVAPAARAADFSATPALVSDYDFRGISLSARDLAAQLSLDLALDHGIALNAFVSQVDFGLPGVDLELDYTLSWSHEFDAAGLEGGVAYYSYPGDASLDYAEYYVGASRALSEAIGVDGRVWYSWDYAGTGEHASYVETNAYVALPANLALRLHVGHSDGRYWDTQYGGGYLDWAVGVGTSVGMVEVELALVDGSQLPDEAGADVNSTDRKLVLSVAAGFSWSR